VSEHPPDRIVKRHVFFRRNALLVALSDIVVVTESPWRSGARNAAKWARRLARPVFVVPHSPWNRPGLGWLEEHRLGAGLVQGARDVLDALGRLNLHALGSTECPKGAQLELCLAPSTKSPPPDALLALLRRGPRHLDDLVEQSGLSAAEVQTAVAELTLEDRVAVSALGVVSLPR
jgi:DNA processing protein